MFSISNKKKRLSALSACEIIWVFSLLVCIQHVKNCGGICPPGGDRPVCVTSLRRERFLFFRHYCDYIQKRAFSIILRDFEVVNNLPCTFMLMVDYWHSKVRMQGVNNKFFVSRIGHYGKTYPFEDYLGI